MDTVTICMCEKYCLLTIVEEISVLGQICAFQAVELAVV